MKEELSRRMRVRGNPQKMIDEYEEKFDAFYEMNKNENKSAVKYEFGKDEYLEDILKLFGCKF